MKPIRLALVAVLAVAALVAAGSALAARSSTPGAVYTETNSPSGNAIAAFTRDAGGTLTPAGSFATGGAGTGANLGSQGAVTISDDGRQLFAVNAGSNSVSAFAIESNGLRLQDVVSSGGRLPISVAVDKGLAYVLNAGGTPNITGFTVNGSGLKPLPGSTRSLGAGTSGPAQVGFAPSGNVLVVTEKTSNSIDTFAVAPDGRAGNPTTSPSIGATPFGFDFDNRGHLLVSDAGNAASSYSIEDDGSLAAITAPVDTHQAAPCWLVTTPNGRFAYTANAGGGTISGFSVAPDGSLALLNGDGATATPGAGSHPLDEAISRNGRFLYVLTDGFHSITGYAIGADGSLTPITAIGGLPAGSVGLAGR